MTVSENTFVTLAEANDYFQYYFGIGTTWTSLTDDEKKSALVTAFRWLINLTNYNISASSTGEKIKNAQILLALYIVKNYETHRKRGALYAQGVRDFSVSKWRERLERSGLPFDVEDILSDFRHSGYFGRFQRAE